MNKSPIRNLNKIYAFVSVCLFAVIFIIFFRDLRAISSADGHLLFWLNANNEGRCVRRRSKPNHGFCSVPLDCIVVRSFSFLVLFTFMMGRSSICH